MAESTDGNAPFFVDNEVIVVNKHGVWIADGHEISHEPTRKLFARSLKHDEKGYFLKIGRETKRIEIEDTAYFVHRIDGEPGKGMTVWVNDEQQEKLDPESLRYRPGRLTCSIIRDGRAEEAKFLHAAYFDLLKHLGEDESIYFLDFAETRITLSKKTSSGSKS